jgi:hypothetical protein
MQRKPIIHLVTILVLSGAAVGLLYLVSLESGPSAFAFKRDFPDSVLIEKQRFELGLNSYTLLAAQESVLLLGNRTAPRLILKYDLLKGDTSSMLIDLSDMGGIPFRSPALCVDSSFIYLSDPGVPVILRGDLATHKLETRVTPPAFSDVVPIAGKGVVLKVFDRLSGSDEVGLLDDFTGEFKPAINVLQKQVDGIFCVDGMMILNRELRMLIYVYYYRNEFICMDYDLNILCRGKTIDPIDSARIEVGGWNKDKGRVMTLIASPPLVNYRVATAGTSLYLISNIRSENDDHNRFKSSYVVDVYDLVDYHYRFSFYLVPPTIKGELVNFDLYARGNLLFAIFDFNLIIYTVESRRDHSRGNSVVSTR